MILSIILPFHHEGKNIVPTLQGLQNVLNFSHEILLVYDQKDDPTLPFIKSIQPGNDSMQIILNAHGCGVGGAVLTGLEKAQGRYILFLVADDQGPLAIIKPMLNLMEQGYDLVSGSRYAKGGRVLGGGLGAKIVSFWGNRLFSWIASSQFSDATCGIKMFRRSILSKIRLNITAGWAFAFELAIQAQQHKLKVAEIPYISANRLEGGKSHFKTISRGYEYGKIFLKAIDVLRLKKQMPKYITIKHCQICGGNTDEVLSLGRLPLVDNLIEPGASQNGTQYPTTLHYCARCQLVALGCIVETPRRFPADYPYTSHTTKALRDNFAQLASEVGELMELSKTDLVLDIGCNDGTLLNNFKDRARVLGVTPENMGDLARSRGIDVIQSYFTAETAEEILKTYGKASLITATNVLAHFDDINKTMCHIKQLLAPQGLFVSESGYLFAMLEDQQYDSIHHEHLRYYSLTRLKALFDRHGLDIIHAKKIDTHGGSLRVYASHQGRHPCLPSVDVLLKEEAHKELKNLLDNFRREVQDHKGQLYRFLTDLKKRHKTIQGIGAPGRAVVLMNYAGLDSSMIDAVAEQEGSYKIGKIIPGTRIKIIAEHEFLRDQPDYALMLSWHIAAELMPKLKARGFRGDFILPLPKPVIIANRDVP